ncbi:MAG: extracellular solute-binding protein [Chloroflexota bacterium]
MFKKTSIRFMPAMLLVLGLVLVACQPETVEVTRVVTETVTETVTEEVEVEVTRVVEGEVITETVTEEVEVEVTRVVEVEAMEELPFAGVEVNILTIAGDAISGPLRARAPDFEALTGATINISDAPFADLYNKILVDAADANGEFDGYVFAVTWTPDFAAPGFLEDLGPYVANDASLQWDDVTPFFREFSSAFEGTLYTIPLDGDFHQVYYRSDVLDAAGLEPPQTWEDYLAIAEAVHGQDMNGDGEADFGSCIGQTRNGQAYWFVHSIASGYLQSQGTGQGGFFNPADMTPLVNSAGFIRALEIYGELTQYGPPDQTNIDVGDTRGLWQAGRCALTLDWGDIGPLSIDTENAVPEVQSGTGAVVLPGSTEVMDWESGELVACDDTTCPHAIDGVNHAPFGAFGGWSAALRASSDAKDATYAFFAYMNAPEQSNVDVTIGSTGFNPYRQSQFLNRQLWVEAGMSPEFASNYLGALEAGLNSPNFMLDLRIPNGQQYQQVILDTVVSQYLAGEFTAAEAAAEIESQWEALTDELGREEQLAAYRKSLGLD